MIKLLIDIIYFLIPKKIFDFICFLVGYKYFKISYSQSGEDLILLKYLKNKKIEKGKYLDIGAFHPRWVSNTYLLHKKGFTGYCVDLDEERLRWFRFARGSRVKTICGAISNSKSEVKSMISKATEDAEKNIIKTNKDFHNLMENRKMSAEERIKQLKNQAIKDIKNASVLIAIESVEKLLKNSLDKSKLDKIYMSSIKETKLALKKKSS